MRPPHVPQEIADQVFPLLAVLLGHAGGIGAPAESTQKDLVAVANRLHARYAEMRARVQGNRPDSHPMSYADLKLLMVGTLKLALAELEGTEA